MYKYLLIITCLGIFACNSQSNTQSFENAWHYSPAHNNLIIDHNCQSLITKYQYILTGLSNKDSLYLNNATKDLIKISDSLLGLNLVKDSLLNHSWSNGLTNLHAELQGILAADNPNELNMAVHMTGVQMLNMLAEIGYKEHVIYIFNVNDHKYEDGLIWFGLLKTARDPFHTDKHNMITASQILQE